MPWSQSGHSGGSINAFEMASILGWGMLSASGQVHSSRSAFRTLRCEYASTYPRILQLDYRKTLYV